MRVVLLSRVPRWYSFRNDRLVARLRADGHEVAGVVAERRDTLLAAREWLVKLGPRVVLEKALRKGAGRLAAAAPAGTGVRAGAPPVYFVDSHNSPECVERLRALAPDVLVLRGCGIVKRVVLEVPRLGTVNPHYALLPAYRGMDVTEWAALHGDPVAVSVHWVAEGVDTGGVIASRRIEVAPGDTVGLLREKSAAAAVDLIAEALAAIAAGRAHRAERQPAGGRQYFQMHPRLRALADRRLGATA